MDELHLGNQQQAEWKTKIDRAVEFALRGIPAKIDDKTTIQGLCLQAGAWLSNFPSEEGRLYLLVTALRIEPKCDMFSTALLTGYAFGLYASGKGIPQNIARVDELPHRDDIFKKLSKGIFEEYAAMKRRKTFPSV